MSEAVQRTQSEGGAHLLTTQQLAVSSHSSASNYVDPTPLLARRPQAGGEEKPYSYLIPLVAWSPARNGEREVAPPLPKRKRTRMTEAEESALISQSDVEMYKTNSAAEPAALGILFRYRNDSQTYSEAKNDLERNYSFCRA